MRSGMVYVYLDGGNTLREANFIGFIKAQSAVDWGSVLYPNSTGVNSMASFLFIKPADVEPLRYSVRLYAQSLRCLSTAVEGEERWKCLIMKENSMARGV